MANITVSEYMSLDGVIEEPAWTMPFWNDEIAAFKGDEMAAIDALLLGRVTYQGFAQAWPKMAGQSGADKMNSMPKYVASRTLDTAAWNAALLGGDVAEAVAALKQQPGQDLLVYGSADFVQTLIAHNLVDQYNLLVYPVVLGSGKRLFKDGSTANLQLVEARSFSSGVVALTYVPA